MSEQVTRNQQESGLHRYATQSDQVSAIKCEEKLPEMDKRGHIRVACPLCLPNDDDYDPVYVSHATEKSPVWVP